MGLLFLRHADRHYLGAFSNGLSIGITSKAEVTAEGQLHERGHSARDGSSGLDGTDMILSTALTLSSVEQVKMRFLHL